MNLSALVLSNGTSLASKYQDAIPTMFRSTTFTNIPSGLGRKRLSYTSSRRTRTRTLSALATELKTLKKAPLEDRPINWQTDIEQKFDFGKTLGEGQQGIVKEAICKKTGFKYAVKIMSKKVQGRINAPAVKRMKAEATFLAAAQTCPFAVKLIGGFEDEENVYLVMDCLKGGSLAENLEAKGGRLTEAQTAHIMYQVFCFLATTHAQGVCYGDLKPANFMLTAPVGSGQPCVAKAVDFGCCQKVVPGLRFRCKTGTPLYMAPEVHVRNYGVESDVWSAAVMMYQMLSGSIPFVLTDRRGNVRDMGIHLGYDFDGEEWQNISSEAKDLLNKIFIKEKSKRISAKDAINHPWFAKYKTKYASNIITLKAGSAKFSPLA